MLHLIYSAQYRLIALVYHQHTKQMLYTVSGKMRPTVF